MIVFLSAPGHEGLSGDAWATLVGAIIAAAVAIAVMVLQRRGEQRDRKDEQTRRRKALATAILFEIDRFYRLYIDKLLVDLSASQSQCPILEAPGPSAFPVYTANCGHLGDLDRRLVEVIVDFYAPAQRHALRLQALALSLPKMKSSSEQLIPLAYIACAYLCEYTGIPFKPARLTIAKGKGMSQDELAGAEDAVANFRSHMEDDGG